MPSTTIKHIIALPQDAAKEDYTFFQGFSRVLFPDYLEILHALSIFPHDLCEIFLEKEEYVLSRVMGSSLDVTLVRENLINVDVLNKGEYAVVLWSGKETQEAVAEKSRRLSIAPIHISTSPWEGAVEIGSLTTSFVTELLRDLLQRAAAVNPVYQEAIRYFYRKSTVTRDEGKLPFAPLSHNCTLPMIRTLESYGFDVSEKREVSLSIGNSEYVEGIEELAHLIENIRRRADVKTHIRKGDIIVYCPSIYGFMYKADSANWNHIYRKTTKEGRNFLKRAIIRNGGYGHAVVQLTKKYDPYKDKIVGPLLVQRQVEAKLFTAFVSILASNQFCTAVRLPSAVMLHHNILEEIYQIACKPYEDVVLEASKKLKQYADALREDTGDKILSLAFADKEKVLAICDFPIEWISFGMVPLMFTHEISRIPTTPGNLSGKLILDGGRVIITPSQLSKILIIRSFAQDDAIRGHIEDALHLKKEDGYLKNIEISLVDVSSAEEVVFALNSFTGATVVFDCHGNHDGIGGISYLHIGENKLDIWSLANTCRIPPIVMLSACSTHPINGSHGSVANGLFRCGAQSVIGTFAPIEANHAAKFIAGLLHLVSEYIPVIARRMPVTWRSVVSNYLKISYANDILYDMWRNLALMSEDQFVSLSSNAQEYINAFQSDWLNSIHADIKAACGIDEQDMSNLVRERYQYVETMLFVSLGRPENILIARDDAVADLYGR